MDLLLFECICTVSDIIDEVFVREDILLCDPFGPADVLGSAERMIFLLWSPPM